jgi:hypothetical protein
MPTKREEEEAANRQKEAAAEAPSSGKAPPEGQATTTPASEGQRSTSASPGWYPDPRAPHRQRYWDGTRWSEQTRARKGGGFVAGYRRLPMWAQVGIPILIALFIIGAATGNDDSGGSGPSDQQSQQVAHLKAQLERERAKASAERRLARKAAEAKKRAQAKARHARVVAAAKAKAAREVAAEEAATSRAVEAEEEAAASQAVEEESSEATNSECDPNYTGCVPDTGSDVDCAEVPETVEVIGSDVDGLDADGDGVGCE